MEQELWSVAPEAYGADYQRHLLEQYKLYVEMADRISSRRGTANNFLLSVNALLLSGFGILASTTDAGSQAWSYALPLAGFVVCGVWYVLIRSYRQLNSGKFKVLHELEKRLPAALYDAEWKALDEGRGKDYLALTRVEPYIPAVFAVLYLAFIGAAIFDALA